MSPTNLILASGSAARSQMLSSAGVVFQTNVARIDEELIKASMAQEEYPPRDIADALAQAKAAKVSSRHPGALVLGADQILVFDGKIYDKPKSLEDAQTQLKLNISGIKEYLYDDIRNTYPSRRGRIADRSFEISIDPWALD